VLIFIIIKKSITNFAFRYSTQLLLMPVPFFVTHLLVVCVVQLAFVGLVAILFYYMHFSSTKWRQTSPHGPVQGLFIALGWILRRVCRGEHRYGCGYLAPCFCVAASGFSSFFFFAPRLSFTSGFTFSQLFRLWLFNSLPKVDGGFCRPNPNAKSRHRRCPTCIVHF